VHCEHHDADPLFFNYLCEPTMSPATPTLPFSDPELFQQAAEAAECQYSAWIRATLRQVAVEGIKKSLTVNHDLNQLILSQAAWKQVESFCKRVTSRWCEKLELIGHKAVAARIREIVSQESASLFAPNTSVPAAAAAAAAEKTDENPAAPSFEQLSTNVPATEPVSAPLLPNNQTATCITAYSRLRQLGQRNVLATSPQPLLSADKAGAYLRKAGRLHLTEWPYDWRLIEEAVAQVPARLHNRNTGDFVTLIPKSVWEQQQQQHQGQQQDEESNPSLGVTQEAAQWLLNRKRKSAGRERLKPPRRQIDESSSTAGGGGSRTMREQDIPRPFSRDDGTAQWTIQQIKSGWSRSERQQLDSYLHDDHMDDESGNPAPSIILGALSDGGRFHRWKQKEIDENGSISNNNNDDDDSNKYTEKKRRRLQNDAVKERLGDHQEETSDFLAGRRQRVSRVMRTCTTTSTSKGSSDKNANNSCFDFDMSDSWLEWIDPGTGDRTLYAFSSLEVIALDQDEDTDNDGNDENDEDDQIIDMREDED
jgi:hypothetical protein